MRLSQVRLLVYDVAACFRFYRDVLGLSPTFGGEDDAYASFAAGDSGTIALFARSAQGTVVGLEAPGDGAVLCLEVDDLDREIQRVEDAGGAFLGPTTARPDWGIRVAYLRDPAGNLVELHEVIPMEEA